MNKTEFIQHIQHPENLSAKDVAALKQVVADFPYFTSSQVLLTKALFNEKHYEYEKYLKQTALFVPDREVLYNYLHQVNQQEALVQHKEISVVPDISHPVVADTQPIVENREIHQPEINELLVDEMLQEETSIDFTETPNEPTEVETEEIVNEVDIQAEHPVETEINIAAPQEEEKEEVIAVAHEKTEPAVEPQTIIQTSSPTETHSFMEWLQLASKQTIIEPVAQPVKPQEKIVKAEPTVEETPVEPVAVVQETTPAEEKLATTEPQTFIPNKPLPEVTKEDIEKSVANSNVNVFTDILDKFIKENPSISRPKAEFFNPVNMAKQSVEEDDNLVTETLANLYYKQGNLKKAIKAYEKLCLLYPSKMTYFASLIQKIKTELKD